MTFYLGTHQPDWLARVAIPLFISRSRLAHRRTLPRATAPWALDSGGFTHLRQNGAWTLPPADYAREVRRFAHEIGRMAWAAPQDWMCEPDCLKRTGLTIRDHQQRTTDNFRLLQQADPDLPWIPVLQGWQPDDYLRHADLYHDSGVELSRYPLVGIGSICRRQDTRPIERLARALPGLRIHAFGFKIRGLKEAASLLNSSDSLAWSMHARRRPPLPGCLHKSCSNCLLYAIQWRQKVTTLLLKG